MGWRWQHTVGAFVVGFGATTASFAQPVSFTGHTMVDFPENLPNIMLVKDPGQQPDVGVLPGMNSVSGWDVEDIRMRYDPEGDVLYVGFNTFQIAGDADGDGDPGRSSGLLVSHGGVDAPDLGASESITLAIDLDEDGLMDVVVGVPVQGDITDFQVARYNSQQAANPGAAFGETLPQHKGTLFGSPSAQAPHFQFTVRRFSELPLIASGALDRSASFAIRAFAGSSSDSGIGEDFVPSWDGSISVCPTPNAEEICNGFDDNCDGTVDEGFPVGEPCTVGLGACKAEGVYVCDGPHNVRCDAVPGDPQPELCNGIDDDCDGEVDEDFEIGAFCTVGLGICLSEGVMVCDGENASICSGVPGDPLTGELCNGIDDNCDGQIDEGFPVGELCTVGLGICESQGRYVCSDNQLGVRCDALPGDPLTGELCNGLDDNCDGQIDEDFHVGETCTAGLGICQTEGVMICDSLESSRCTAVANDHLATEEVCNGLDDNCDGQIDEGLYRDDCLLPDEDICRQGRETCVDGEYKCVPVVLDRPELCNGLDDNCDGQIDEGFNVGEPCTIEANGCLSEGQLVCAADGRSAVCDAPERSPTREVCNGIDDNCDGQIDEGFNVGEPCSVGEGICRQEGLFSCDDRGGVFCELILGRTPSGTPCTPGEDHRCEPVAPLPEGCDNSDAGRPLSVTGTDLIDNFGCRAGGQSGGALSAWWLVLAALGGGLRRRRRGQKEHMQ